MSYKAFSLIELMIVVGIIAALASIAVPNYQAYIARTRIASALNSIDDFINNITNEYERDGSWPTVSTTFLGLNLNINTWSSFTPIGDSPMGEVAALRYNINFIPDPINPTAITIQIRANISNLGGSDPDYVDPIILPATPTTSFEHSVIDIVRVFSMGSYRHYCGTITNGSTESVDFDLLPATCTCTVLDDVFNSNDTSSCS